MLRAAALERQALPEHDKLVRRSRLRRCRDRIRQCHRRQLAMAWYSVVGESVGELAEVGKDITIYWGLVYGARSREDADEEESLS